MQRKAEGGGCNSPSAPRTDSRTQLQPDQEPKRNSVRPPTPPPHHHLTKPHFQIPPTSLSFFSHSFSSLEVASFQMHSYISNIFMYEPVSSSDASLPTALPPTHTCTHTHTRAHRHTISNFPISSPYTSLPLSCSTSSSPSPSPFPSSPSIPLL